MRLSEKAELVLPSGTFAESDGTFISSEGRAQRFFQVFVPSGDYPGKLALAWTDDSWHSLDEVLAAMATALPQLAPARDAAPSAQFRMAGAKVAALAAPSQRPHGDAGQHQRLGAQAAG